MIKYQQSNPGVIGGHQSNMRFPTTLKSDIFVCDCYHSLYGTFDGPTFTGLEESTSEMGLQWNLSLMRLLSFGIWLLAGITISWENVQWNPYKATTTICGLSKHDQDFVKAAQGK